MQALAHSLTDPLVECEHKFTLVVIEGLLVQRCNDCIAVRPNWMT